MGKLYIDYTSLSRSGITAKEMRQYSAVWQELGWDCGDYSKRPKHVWSWSTQAVLTAENKTQRAVWSIVYKPTHNTQAALDSRGTLYFSVNSLSQVSGVLELL